MPSKSIYRCSLFCTVARKCPGVKNLHTELEKYYQRALNVLQWLATTTLEAARSGQMRCVFQSPEQENSLVSAVDDPSTRPGLKADECIMRPAPSHRERTAHNNRFSMFRKEKHLFTKLPFPEGGSELLPSRELHKIFLVFFSTLNWLGVRFFFAKINLFQETPFSRQAIQFYPI